MKELIRIGTVRFPKSMTLDRFQDNLYFQLNRHGFKEFYISDLKLIEGNRLQLAIHSFEESEWLEYFTDGLIDMAIGCDLD